MTPTPALDATSTKPNWSLLAGVRFVLAAAIVFIHLDRVNHESLLVRAALQFNGLAVVVAFLLISGFSISHSIHARPHGFFWRRLQRIYPVFFLCLLLSLLPFAIAGSVVRLPHGSFAAPSPLQFGASVAMLQNTLELPVSTFNPSWSLALECALYLCAPYFAGQGRKWVIPFFMVSVGFFVIVPLGFLPSMCDLYYADMVAMLPAVFLAWAWLLGWLLERYRGRWQVNVVAFSAPFIFACNSHEAGRLGGVVIGAAVLALIYGPRLRLSASAQKAFAYLGDLSYPLYMCHYPLMCLLYCVTKSTALLPYILAATGGALIVLHLVDFPCRKRLKLVNCHLPKVFVWRRERVKNGA